MVEIHISVFYTICLFSLFREIVKFFTGRSFSFLFFCPIVVLTWTKRQVNDIINKVKALTRLRIIPTVDPQFPRSVSSPFKIDASISDTPYHHHKVGRNSVGHFTRQRTERNRDYTLYFNFSKSSCPVRQKISLYLWNANVI